MLMNWGCKQVEDESKDRIEEDVMDVMDKKKTKRRLSFTGVITEPKRDLY